MLETILLIKSGDSYTVVIDGLGSYAEGLCPDEALGVVAASLYGGKMPVWVCSAKGHAAKASRLKDARVDSGDLGRVGQGAYGEDMSVGCYAVECVSNVGDRVCFVDQEDTDICGVTNVAAWDRAHIRFCRGRHNV